MKPLSVSLCISVHSFWSEFDTFIQVCLSGCQFGGSIWFSIEVVSVSAFKSVKCVGLSVRWSLLVSHPSCLCVQVKSVSLAVRWFIWCPIKSSVCLVQVCQFGFAVVPLVSHQGCVCLVPQVLSVWLCGGSFGVPSSQVFKCLSASK